MLQVILFGYNHDNPTADYVEFLDFAASLAAPDIHDMLKSGTPLTPVMRCECLTSFSSFENDMFILEALRGPCLVRRPR
jgi:hypothetical protein